MTKEKIYKEASLDKPQEYFHMKQPSTAKIIHGDCFTAMDDLEKKGEKFNMIFADPPYFLSNGGVTCHSGKMVKVDKGDWDESMGPELNHEFNREWIRRCRDLLTDDGTLWVSGTMHVIYSIGYAMQQLEMKILNNITWRKPNPPPHLAGRYYTHSTETVLWSRKTEKSKHYFNYALMKEENQGKQMKDVWEFTEDGKELAKHQLWTMTSPKKSEKTEGKHPTQKPIELLDRIIRSSTQEGDLILDPFLGSGTTSIAALAVGRRSIGIEQDIEYCELAKKRLQAEQKRLRNKQLNLLEQ